MKLSRIVWVSFLAFVGGCFGNSASDSHACRSLCEDVCKNLATCNAGGSNSPTCIDDCFAGIGSSSCAGARPADQLTCAEVEQVFDCANYCGTLCHNAPQCGSFDEKLCARGCASSDPPVCNAASVAARTCDQMKPELRQYEDRGRSLATGGVFGGSSNPTSFGLCRNASDCTSPLGCSAATNTCAPCAADPECAQGVGKYMCSPAAECVPIDCRIDADCNVVYTACNQTTFKCVECTRDEHCASSFLGKKCDPASSSCRQCLTNADCADPTPTCHTDIHLCEPAGL